MASAILKVGGGVGRIWTGVSRIHRHLINPLAVARQLEFHTQPPWLGSSKILMPSLSPTMTEGTIVKWHKKEGDPIAAGDVLCDIQTDKAVVSMDTEEEGIMAKILMPENSKDIQVGTLIAIMVEEGDDWQNVEVPADTGAPASAPAPPAAASDAPEPAAAAGGGGKLPEGTSPLLMPSLSPTMTEGTIVKWHKKAGDAINPGDLLCDIQTDKAVVSMDTEEEGVLVKILKEEGSSEVKVGTLIGVMAEAGVDVASLTIPDNISLGGPSPAPSAAPSPPPKAPSPAAAPAPTSAPTHTVNLHGLTLWPSVRKLLEEYNISPSDITSTGRNGRMLKQDVLNHIQSKNLKRVDMTAAKAAPSTAAPSTVPSAGPTPSPASPAPLGRKEPFIDIPLSNMRKIIAKRLTESKTTIPHSYATIASNVNAAGQLRKQLIDAGFKVSMNDFIIKAAGLALLQHPQVNALWKNDGPEMQGSVDISIAVATESGLITPIVKDVPNLGVDQISAAVKDLATRARANKLQLHEFQGGSFSISNLGMFGISEFSAVINPPQAAILAVGGTVMEPGMGGGLEPSMKVTLSYDARILDEMQASEFLETFRAMMETPRFLVAGSSLASRVRAFSL